jgi:hypothetical protein
MKKHIAKTIPILCLYVMLSVSASKVSAGGGCSTCQPQTQYAVSASAQSSARDPDGQGAASTTQPENSFSLAFFLAELAMSLLHLP